MTTFWAGRRVLVTGATGVVGSWLCKALVAADSMVTALVRDLDPLSELCRSGTIRRVRVAEGQLEDYRAVERAVTEHEVETVFHLGAQTIVGTAHRSPLATLEANVRGTWNVLEACRQHRDLVERIVIASSDKAYGATEGRAYTEDMPLKPTYPYEVSKACADLIAQTYHHTYGLAVTVARCGNIYGGGDLNWSRIVPGTIRALLRDERPVIRSNGRYVRDYVYVEDAVAGYLALAEHAKKGGVAGCAFNFSSGSRLPVLEMVAEITTLLGKSDVQPIVLDQATGEIQEQSVDASAAHAALGWHHTYSLAEGLTRTLGWYRELLREG